MNQNRSILLTGGHAATTALATIEEINKRNKFEKIYWIGNKKAFEKNNTQTIENFLFKDLEVEIHNIDSGRLQRKWTPETITSLVKIPTAFVKAFLYINKIKPDIVVSFGGSISVPVVITSWLLGIPVMVHEQTVAAGLANRISSTFAEKIALARIESKKYFGDKKVVHVGNPINSSIREITRKKIDNTIFITGGSRGSKTINKVIFDSLDELTKNYQIIHQTGQLDFSKAKKIQNKNYKAYSTLNPKDIKKIYETCKIVVCRSGANTVSELIAFSIPSILVPIPWVQHNEQFENAQLAVKSGNGIIIKEDDFSQNSLINNINQISKNYKKYSTNKMLETTKKDLEAHVNLVNLIEEVFE